MWSSLEANEVNERIKIYIEEAKRGLKVYGRQYRILAENVAVKSLLPPYSVR